jgi:anti-sigma regulatory factor (Ser/Thr protein kinase)
MVGNRPGWGIRFEQTFVPDRASSESLEENPVTMTREAAQQFCLPPLLANAAAVRRAVTSALTALGASGDEAADMVLAVNEAFNNAVCHGRMTHNDQLTVAIEGEGAELVVTLLYRGDPFPVTSPILPEPTDPHGRGRYLMERLTDRVSYEFHDGWTHTELRKQLQGR